MTVRVRKTEARQGRRRRDQERILIWSLLTAVLSLGAVALAWILLGPFGG